MPRTIERCRTIIDALDEGICSIDAEGRTSFVNLRLTEILGLRTEEVLGRPVFDLVDSNGTRPCERRSKTPDMVSEVNTSSSSAVRIGRRSGSRSSCRHFTTEATTSAASL